LRYGAWRKLRAGVWNSVHYSEREGIWRVDSARMQIL